MDFYDALQNYLVWPSVSDHHGDDYGAGAGLILDEPIITSAWYHGGPQANRVVSGFVLPSTGSATNATITAGTAIIGGYIVKGTDNIVTVDFTDTTSYVYLCLSVTSEKIVQPLIKVEISRLLAATGFSRYYLLLGTVTAAAGTISSAVDMRHEGRQIWGSITHSEAGASTIANAGSANWAVSKSGARTVATFDIPFALKAPCVVVSGGASSVYSKSTTTVVFDADDANTFDFIAIG